MTPITGSVPVTLWVMKDLGRYSPIVLHLAFEDLCKQIKRKRSAEGSVLALVVSSTDLLRSAKVDIPRRPKRISGISGALPDSLKGKG